MPQLPATKRAYDNRAREKRKQATRDLMLQTMVAMLADGADDVQVQEVAAIAGVSVRTVYQHFPNRDARIAAIDAWINARTDVTPVLPRNFEDIPSYAERAADFVFDNEPVIRAQMNPGLASDLRGFRKRGHVAALRRCLRERIDDERVVAETTALIVVTVRAESMFDLRDRHGLARARIKALLVRSVRLLLREVAGQV